MRALVMLVLLTSLAAADDKPCATALVVDRGMSSEKLALVSEAIGGAKRMRGDQVTIVAAGKTASVAKKVTHEDGGANIVGAIELAGQLVRKSKLTRRQVIVVTDGDATIGVAAAVRKQRESEIGVSAIGFDGGNTRTRSDRATGRQQAPACRRCAGAREGDHR